MPPWPVVTIEHQCDQCFRFPKAIVLDIYDRVVRLDDITAAKDCVFFHALEINFQKRAWRTAEHPIKRTYFHLFQTGRLTARILDTSKISRDAIIDLGYPRFAFGAPHAVTVGIDIVQLV